MKKDVLVINTRGNNEMELNGITSNTLSELYQILDQNGISYKNKTLSIGESSVTLDHPDMRLPDHNFTLYVYPVKNKGGICLITLY